MVKRSAESIIQEAEELLQTARFGLEDMRTRPERARSGLRNVVIFGRSVTFALQNLRNVVDNFDAWYNPIQQDLKSNPLASYFYDLRTKIEKQAQQLPVGARLQLKRFDDNSIKHFLPSPPNATGLVIGDSNGGSGWIVKTAHGVNEMYYIDLPPSIGKVDFMLVDAP